MSACWTFSYACWRISWKFGGAVVRVGGSDKRRFCMIVVCAWDKIRGWVEYFLVTRSTWFVLVRVGQIVVNVWVR